MFVDPDTDTLLWKFWAGLFFSTPVLLLLQLAALGVLLWRVAIHWRPRQLGVRSAERWTLLLGAALAPVLMLLASAPLSGGYQGERGGWFFHIHSGLAALALVPVYAVGSFLVGRGIVRTDYRLQSGIHIVVLHTLLWICCWYAFATAALGMSDDRSQDMSAAAIVPAAAAINYALLLLDVYRHDQWQPTPLLKLWIWFSALALSLLAKIPLAMRLYDTLPPERPDGYGDCFVVSAAARGHAGVVGSHFDPQLGRTVNLQWHSLRAFENHLMAAHPQVHGYLRSAYNRVGPAVAARIRSPYAADLVYCLLKPAEWLTRLYLATVARHPDHRAPVQAAGWRD